MSHVVKIEVLIKDLNALEKAGTQLMYNGIGCKFIKDKKEYNWWGRHVGDYPLPEGMTVEEMGKCDHVIKVPGAEWEIGVVKEKDEKGYKLIYDFYGEKGKAIERVCGPQLGKLKQRYTIEALKNKVKDKKKIKEEQLEKGKIRVTIEV